MERKRIPFGNAIVSECNFVTRYNNRLQFEQQIKFSAVRDGVRLWNVREDVIV